jgi:hypothetical protein
MNTEPYWELETPIDAINRNVRLRYYRQAGRLQISALYCDWDTKEIRAGKTVVLDRRSTPPDGEVFRLLKQVVNDWEAGQG